MAFFNKLLNHSEDWSKEELVALVRCLETLAGVDGDYDKDEEKYIIEKMNALYSWSSNEEFLEFQNKLKNLPMEKMLSILSGMTQEKKKIVGESLIELSLVDGKKGMDESMYATMIRVSIGLDD